MVGDAYYTQKSNYGFNVQVRIFFFLLFNIYQIGNTPSNLWITDYGLGLTGAAHDASAFQHTAAIQFLNLLFQGKEFAWANSAYPISKHVIPVHKKPASDIAENVTFDCAVSRL